MPNSTTRTGSKWFTCGLCGREYPFRYKVRQRGLDVCTFLPCRDDPGGQSAADDPRSQITLPDHEVLDARR